MLDAASPYAEIEAVAARLQQRIDANDNGDRFVEDLSATSAQATDWFKEAAGAVADLIEAHESSAPSERDVVDRKAASDDPESLRKRLSAYLERRYPSLPSPAVTCLSVIPGGRAKLTALIELAANDLLPTRLVLRLDTPAGFTGTAVAGEFPLLKMLHEKGLAVPRPILCESGVEALGGGFIIMTEVENAVAAGAPFPEERHAGGADNMGPAFGHEAAAFLAKLHSASNMPAASDGSRLNELSADPSTMVEDYYTRWRSIPRPPLYSLITDLGFAWLRSHPLPADRPIGIVHGDFGAHNMLARDGHLAAVVDWELSHEGDPAEDLGYCRLMLANDLLPWSEFVAAYIDAGGDSRACDTHAVGYFGIWAHVKNGVISSVLRDQIMSGAPIDIELVGGHWHFFHRINQYGARELMLAIDN